MKSNKLIEVGQFCTITTDKLAKYGLKKGNLVFVFGSGALPRGEDPYDLRMTFIILKTKEQVVDFDGQRFGVDPTDLKPVKHNAQVKLEKKLEEGLV